MTTTAVPTRVRCAGCNGAYTLRADGTLRAHRHAGRRCPGSMRPPKAATAASAYITAGFEPDSVIKAVEANDPQLLKHPALSPLPPRPLPPVVLACSHSWSGWTRLPRTTEDFRRCESCQHVELQQRQPCVLCGDQDARAFEVPDYGTAYVCAPCLQGLGQ